MTSISTQTDRTCPVCESRDAFVIKELNLGVPSNFILPKKYNLVSCTNCGCVFCDAWPMDKYDEFYSSYNDNTNYEIYHSNDFGHESNERYRKVINFLDDELNDENKFILDLGCSSGGLLQMLQSNNYKNLYGIDADIKSISLLKEKGIHGYSGNISDFVIPNFKSKFDVITMLHILEHLHYPKEALINIKKYIKPEGSLYIEVPDVERYSQYSVSPGIFVDYAHINHFSLVSMGNMLKTVGFELIKSEQTIMYNIGIEFPVLRMLFRPNKLIDKSKLNFARDDAEKIAQSLSAQTTEAVEQDGIIKRFKETRKPIAIWGAGEYLWTILTHTDLKNCNIKFIVDKNKKKQGAKLNGIIISNPNELIGFDGSIFITSKSSSNKIIENIKALGIENLFFVL